MNARTVPQRAQRVPDVGHDALDPRQPALVAHRLGGLGEPAGREQRLPARLVRVHAAPDVLGGLHLEVGLQLVAEIVVLRRAGEDAGDARERGANVSHGASRRGARKAAIRSAVCMPFARLARQLLAPRGGERVVLRAAVVLGLAPFRLDEPFLLQLEQRGVERAVVEREAVLARLLDAARDAVAVQRPEHLEGLEDHQGEGALLHVQLVRPCVGPMGFPYDCNAAEDLPQGLSYGLPIRRAAPSSFTTVPGLVGLASRFKGSTRMRRMQLIGRIPPGALNPPLQGQRINFCGLREESYPREERSARSAASAASVSNL